MAKGLSIAIVSMIQWIRTSRLLIKISLFSSLEPWVLRSKVVAFLRFGAQTDCERYDNLSRN